jgi:glyoxylase-like metal-dependent hydrolase (beta-lactamase superfamily II)
MSCSLVRRLPYPSYLPGLLLQRTLFGSIVERKLRWRQLTEDDGTVSENGTERLAPGLAAQLRKHTQLAVHTAIFTHGHLDHAYGLKQFLVPDQPQPRIVAQREILDRFARYDRTAGLNAGINARQFGVAPGAQPGDQHFSPPALMPDLLFDERVLLAAGELTFEVSHYRGETDDACWVWCPERRVVRSGDLVINAVPNAGNPQKVQRYPWDWADGLRAIAACEAVSLCPGHGGPVVQDPAKVKRLVRCWRQPIISIRSCAKHWPR